MNTIPYTIPLFFLLSTVSVKTILYRPKKRPHNSTQQYMYYINLKDKQENIHVKNKYQKMIITDTVKDWAVQLLKTIMSENHENLSVRPKPVGMPKLDSSVDTEY